MPKIIKSVRADTLLGGDVPNYYFEAKNTPRFSTGNTILLTSSAVNEFDGCHIYIS